MICLDIHVEGLHIFDGLYVPDKDDQRIGGDETGSVGPVHNKCFILYVQRSVQVLTCTKYVHVPKQIKYRYVHVPILLLIIPHKLKIQLH